MKETPKITVVIRKRPLSKKEQQRGESDIVRVGGEGEVMICESKQKVDLTKYTEETPFKFDYAFDQQSTNELIYESTIRPLIDTAFLGAKVSCFAYGQTGSGKTFTMKGDVQKGVPGLYYLGAKEIFEYLKQPVFAHLRVEVSFFEIYCGKLYDLLNTRKELVIREDKKSNINVIGIEEKPIFSADEFLTLIEYGSNFRVTSQNATNADSSRSHAILQINLKQEKRVFTKISFIDLAGNERGADHMDQNKQTKLDGAQINKSLLSLKECIRALDQGKSHTPFRGSKLTMVLRDSFVGFCKTVMIANVSPNVGAAENTMNTLRYADRVKELKRTNQQPMSREDLLARELMLPRANRGCVRVNVESDEEEEDHAVRCGKRGSNNHLPKARPFEEKMELEEDCTRTISHEVAKRPALAGRRTEDLQVLEDRRKPPLPRSSHNVEPIQYRHRDQNNLNWGNNHFQPTNTIPNLQRKTEPNNRHCPDTQNRDEFEQFKDRHDRLIQEEMLVLKNEMVMKEQIAQEPDNAKDYTILVEEAIRQKYDVLQRMQANLERMRSTRINIPEPMTVEDRRVRPMHYTHYEEQLMDGIADQAESLF